MGKNLQYWIKPRWSKVKAIGSLFICSSLAGYLIAQSSPPARAKNLQRAITHYQNGRLSEAKAALAGIDQQDPDYAVAKCYNALCLYESKDYFGYLKELDSPIIKAATIAPVIREELGYRQIGALFSCRKFEDILPKIQAFENEHPRSGRSAAVKEYHLAALFERGAKKAQESAMAREAGQNQARWREAQTNLYQFIAQASALPAARYRTLSNRILDEDIWTAQITLGQEKEALKKISANDAARREKFALLRVKLYQKLRENDIEENLEAMTKFLDEFPESSGRGRVNFDKATYSFKRVEQFYKEAALAEKAGDPDRAARLRASVRDDLDTFRSLQKEAVADRAAGIESTDIREMRGDLLNSYILEKNYAAAASLANSMVAESTPGDVDWILANTYAGIALQSQSPPRTDEAANAFDKVLGCDFNGMSQQDYFVLAAAKWRIQIAGQDGDLTKAQALVQQVLQGKCRKEMKKGFLNFLKDHPQLAPSSNVPTQL